MTSHETALDEVRERLIKLERENRRLKQIGVAAIIIAASLVVMGQASKKKTVEANEFILRDNSGNVRARLFMDAATPSSPALLLLDGKGEERVRLIGGSAPGSASVGGNLVLSDPQGRKRGVFWAENDGGYLSLNDKKEKVTVMLMGGVGARDPDAGGSIAVSDPQGRMRAGLMANNQSGALTLFDVKRSIITSLYEGGMNVSDAQGFQATLGTQQLVTPRTGETQTTSAASLVLFDKNKNVIWKAP